MCRTTYAAKLFRARKREDGQTLVEFALVLPLIAILLFGVIQFGIVFNNYLTLTDAVRTGARKAAVSRNLGASGASNAAKQAVVDAGVDLKLKTGDVNVSSAWNPGDKVTVQAQYPYSINLLGFVVKSGFLKSATTERVE
jgi:Flp pilus assembly protein TadG